MADIYQRYFDYDHYEMEPEEDKNYFGFEIEEPNGCCAARNLHEFPEFDRLTKDEERQMRDDLINEIQNRRWTNCLIVFTNDNQPETNRVLREIGFKHTRWMNKPDHDEETKIRLWWWEPDRKEEHYVRINKMLRGVE
jgi:hypothetical protein